MNTADNPYAAPSAVVADPETAPQAVPLASRWKRLGAAIIDTVLMIVLVVTLALAAEWLGIDLLGSEDDTATFQELLWAPDFQGRAVWFGSYLLLQGPLLWWRSQTWGKMVVGIRIVQMDGARAVFNRLVVRRELPFVLANAWMVVGGLAWLLDVLLIFRRDRRCLHDVIAGTRVVVAR